MEEILTSEYKELPDDPSVAFVVFESKLQSKYLRGGLEESRVENRLKYVTELEQFIDVFEVPVERRIDFEKNSPATIADKHFLEFYSVVQNEISRFKLLSAKRSHNGVFDHLNIDDNYKGEIRDYISKIKIKIKIEKADIPVSKQDSLLKKLNVFLQELDKTETSLAPFTSAMIQVAAAAGETAEKLEPVMDLFERAMKAIGRGGEGKQKLPRWEAPRQLEGPKDDDLTDDDLEALKNLDGDETQR